MTYEIHCSDVVDGCAFHVESDDEAEVVRFAREHAKAQHAMVVPTEDAERLVKKSG